MADLGPGASGLLAEQERLRPALDRLLALAALWADVPVPPGGAGHVGASDGGVGGSSRGAAAGEIVAFSERFAVTGAWGVVPGNGAVADEDEAAAQLSLGLPGWDGAGPASLRTWSDAGRDVGAGAGGHASVAPVPTVPASLIAGAMDSVSRVTMVDRETPMRLARLPAPRGGRAAGQALPVGRAPFAALAVPAAGSGGAEVSAAAAMAPALVGAAPVRGTTAAGVAFAPSAGEMVAPAAMPPRYVGPGTGSLAQGLVAGEVGGRAEDAVSPWRDGLEDQLADLLERAASEAGVVLP